MSILLSSHITAEAELDPDLVCDVCRAPSANTVHDREVCLCEGYCEGVKDGATLIRRGPR